jgi:hypothetical protein
MSSYSLKGSPDESVTKGRFNPASWEDNHSRSTWLENVTRGDRARHIAYLRNRLMKKYPKLSLEDVEYYLHLELRR